eukprot:13504345-Alexandrium_andersonii.AAC.1
MSSSAEDSQEFDDLIKHHYRERRRKRYERVIAMIREARRLRAEGESNERVVCLLYTSPSPRD